MNKYESIIILNEKINEQEKNNVIKKVKSYINESGKIIEIKDLGLRKLAYDIKKCKRGYYFEIIFSMKENKIIELERIYRILDEIIKFIVIKK